MAETPGERLKGLKEEDDEVPPWEGRARAEAEMERVNMRLGLLLIGAGVDAPWWRTMAAASEGKEGAERRWAARLRAGFFGGREKAPVGTDIVE